MNFISRSCSYSCSFRLISKPIDDQESNFRSQSFSQDSFNSSFSSKSSLPPSIAAVISTSNTLHHHCISTFKPNSSGVLSLTLVGNHLVSGTSTQIHLWPRHPTTTTTAGFIPIPCKSAVKSLQILNENILISAHQDRRIRIWDINKLKIVTTLPSLKDRLAKIMFAKNYVEIRQHKKLTWIHHNDAVSSLAVSMDKSLIYSASWDRSFKVWRSSDFKCLESISNAHDDAINAIVLSVEGFVYTGSADKKIKVWRHDRRDKKHYLIEKLEHHRSAVNALAYDDHASVLISGACSGAMIASERNSGGGDGGHMTVVGALIGHKKAILCVRIVGEFVCSGSADKTVRLWRRSAEKRYSCLGVLEGHGGPVKCLAMAAEISSNGEEEEEEEEEEEGKGYVVYSGSLDGDIKVWKVWVPFAMEEEPLVAKFEG